MSGYKGQRGPNVSQYIANLNQLSPVQGSLEEPVPTSEDDFALFLNNDFFDINNGPVPNFDAPLDLDVEVAAEQSSQPNLGQSSRKHSLHTSADPNMEFNLNGKRLLFLCFPASVYCSPQSGRGCKLSAVCRPMSGRPRHMRTPPCALPAFVTPHTWAS